MILISKCIKYKHKYMALSRSPIQLNKPSPYLKSLNKRASDGDLKDRAVGRDVEINKLSASLLRRRKPNCILVKFLIP